MSIYRPKLNTLYVKNHNDGWWIMDTHGPLYGPFVHERDARYALYVEQEA